MKIKSETACPYYKENKQNRTKNICCLIKMQKYKYIISHFRISQQNSKNNIMHCHAMFLLLPLNETKRMHISSGRRPDHTHIQRSQIKLNKLYCASVWNFCSNTHASSVPFNAIHLHPYTTKKEEESGFVWMLLKNNVPAPEAPTDTYMHRP